MKLDQALLHARETGCTFLKREVQYGEKVVREYRFRPNGQVHGVEHPNRFLADDLLATDWLCSDGWQPEEPNAERIERAAQATAQLTTVTAERDEARACLAEALDNLPEESSRVGVMYAAANSQAVPAEEERWEQFKARCRAARGEKQG